MAVHDDGEYISGPLKRGHVFSIDPQLRVPEEKVYLRYEDVVVITESGYENFTDFLPTELDPIEKLVGRGGMLQAFPPHYFSFIPITSTGSSIVASLNAIGDGIASRTRLDGASGFSDDGSVLVR